MNADDCIRSGTNPIGPKKDLLVTMQTKYCGKILYL
jgi:hypothetical protein